MLTKLGLPIPYLQQKWNLIYFSLETNFLYLLSICNEVFCQFILYSEGGKNIQRIWIKMQKLSHEKTISENSIILLQYNTKQQYLINTKYWPLFSACNTKGQRRQFAWTNFSLPEISGKKNWIAGMSKIVNRCPINYHGMFYKQVRPNE